MSTKQLRFADRSWRNKIIESIRTGAYKPAPTRKVSIPKGHGEFRTLTIPSVIDRMLQAAILLPLTSRIDSSFHPCSFAYRPRKSTLQAIETAKTFTSGGNEIVVSIDIKSCFDAFRHEIILERFKPLVDEPILELIKSWLKSGLDIGGEDIATTEGAPQGGPLSPVSCNLYLHELDLFLERESIKFIRYADDINLFCRNEREAQEALKTCRNYLETTLLLQVNEKKTQVADWHKVDMLGIRIGTEHQLEIAPGRIQRMKDRLSEKVTRKRLRPEKMISVMRGSIQGWNRYYKRILINEEQAQEINVHCLKLLRELHPKWLKERTKISMRFQYTHDPLILLNDEVIEQCPLQIGKMISLCGLIELQSHTLDLSGT